MEGQAGLNGDNSVKEEEVSEDQEVEPEKVEIRERCGVFSTCLKLVWRLALKIGMGGNIWGD